jgi:conjugal transfer/type IV secretion protein DotA/TraY
MLGLGPIGSAAKVSLRMVTQPGLGIVNVVKRLFRKEEVRPLPTAETDTAARFQVAMQVHGRTSEDVAQDVDATRKQFTLYFVLTVLAFCFGIMTFSSENRGGVLVELLGRFALAIPTAAMAIRMSFYNWQLRNRRLGSFRDWLAAPGDWMPPSAAGSVKGSAGLLLAAAVGAGMMVGLPAHAQSAGGGSGSLSQIFSTPDPTKDLWTMMLSYVFPNMDGLGGAMQTTQSQAAFNALSAASGIFLSVLIALGGGMLAWHTLSGTISTAHEGKVLGQRWHLVWAPVRVCTGYAMLAPVSNGFCLAQMLVLQFAIWGGSFGNALWSGYVDALANPSVPAAMSSPTIDPEVAIDVRELMALEVCRATGLIHASEVNNNIGAMTASGGSANTVENATGSAQDSLNNGSTIHTDNVIDTPMASSASWNYFFLDTAATSFTQGDTTNERVYDYGVCGAARITYLTSSGGSSSELTALAAFESARLNAFDALILALRPTAIQIAQFKDIGAQNSQGMPSFTPIVTAASSYQQTVETAINTLQNQMNGGEITQLKTQMKQAGWASAGMFYMAVTRLQNVYHDGLQTPVSFDPPNLKNITQELGCRIACPDLGSIPAFAEWWKAGVLNPGVAKQFSRAADASKISDDDDTGSFYRTVKKILDSWCVGGLRFVLSMWQVDLSKGGVIFNLINVGHTLLTGFWLGAGVLTVGSSGILTHLTAVGSFFGGAPNASLAVEAVHMVAVPFAAIFQMLLIGLASVGVTLAFVVPMMPYTQMLFLTVGMLILTCEAVVAAPIWAFFHIRMDGQEFVDNTQRQGYQLTFNLLLRVSLALMGYFFSFLVLDITMWFVSQTFIPAFLSVADTGSGFGLITILTGVVMMGYMSYQVAVRSFGLITAMPDRVTRWFGASDQTGDERHASDHSTRVLGIVTGHTQGLAQGINSDNKRRKSNPTPVGGKMPRDTEAGDEGGGSDKPDSPTPRTDSASTV